MASLERNLRKDLERAVKKARNVAEAGARQAIAQLGVGEAEAPKHLTAEQRALRNGLRAHGRQLGDQRDPKTGAQATTRLAQECAYEHWHRMLFARFLAETDLLIEPESGVAITLEEAQELAREKGVDWLPLASEYAERMLPQIFRKEDPVLDIALPPETRSDLEDLLKALPKAVFEADDSLGWVYQFWQTEKKEEVNKSEVKIGAEELPAVTQLFTEDYMVLFLLHNTLGAWWAGKVLAGNPDLAISASSEDALRAACRVGELDWTYLRFVRDKEEDGTEGPWRPAAGTFDGWPKAARDITVLDPCMGSGHFLVFALPILVGFRMAEEGLSERDAIDAVLRDNLFGLEIDPRCTQIAAFNLAFAAWKRTGFHALPQLNLACSGLAIGVTKAEWLKLAEKAVTAADPAAKRDLLGVEQNLLTVGLEERVKNGLEALYHLFTKAPWLGSLLDPRRISSNIFNEGFDRLEPLLDSILASADSDEVREATVAAQGMSKALELLRRRFVLVGTNPPYLVRGKQGGELMDFSDNYCSSGASDIATVFLRRIRDWGSTYATVLPQNWLYQKSYSAYRAEMLSSQRFNIVGAVGSGATATASWDVLRCLSIVEARKPNDNDCIRFIETDAASDADRSIALQRAPVMLAATGDIAKSKDTKILLGAVCTKSMLSDFADSYQGIKTGDDGRLRMSFWEVPLQNDRWQPLQSSVTSTQLVGGLSGVVDMSRGGALLARKQGLSAWGRLGVVASQMRDLPASHYWGTPFDSNVSAIVPRDPKHVSAVWRYCADPQYAVDVRKIDKSLAATNGSMAQVAFDPKDWADPEVVNPSQPDTDDPTQWFFHGAPGATPATLAVSVALLAGFSWPTAVRQIAISKRAEELVLTARAAQVSADRDGIICVPAVKGEAAAAERLNSMLHEVLGLSWSASRLAALLGEAGYAGKSLDDWLRDGFFAQHCELFHQRPFIWHIWDGRRDGFHALVNYHRLAAPNGEGRRTLEKLIYSYLGDWIDRQRDEQKAGVEGADARLAHAEHLRAELIKILEGEPRYDIFVRWKPLHEQPIGWDPDINDGVRMNIRPFMTARPLGAKAKGACILRATPKIKWDKDRGKEPNRDKADYPWFWGWDEASGNFAGGATFDGNRWNDLHYSRSVKQAARDRHAAKAGTKP